MISIGEGILAGLAYFVFGAVSLHSLQAGHRVVSLTLSLLTLVTRNVPNNSVFISASKSSIRRFVITEKAPTRAFSWLKAFTFKTLLRHYAKRAVTPRSLNVKLGL